MKILRLGRLPKIHELRRCLVKIAELESPSDDLLTPIDMKHARLFRAHLFRLGVDDHVLLLILLHDVVIDSWSNGGLHGGAF